MSKDRSVYSNVRSGVADDEGDYGAHQASFSSIFAFTHKKHLAVLIPALLLTTIGGAIKTCHYNFPRSHLRRTNELWFRKYEGR